MKFERIIVTFILIVCFTSNVWGLGKDNTLPIYLSADSAQIDNKTGIGVYKGNVSITQGSTELSGEVVTIYTHNKKITKIVTRGNDTHLAYFKEDQDHNQGEVKAWAGTISYDVEKCYICLEHKAKITRARQIFTGNYILYNKKLKTVFASGDKNKRRVELIIQPEKSDTNTTKNVENPSDG